MSPSDAPAEPTGSTWRRELCAVLAVVMLAKLLLLAIDPNLRLFMGDSASYLHAALSDWEPPDRSISYPWLIALTAVPAQSAMSLVIVQTLMGIAGCLLIYWMLRRAAGASPIIAGGVALLVAIEPSQLFYERMLMAESAGLLALLGLTAATLAYVRDGRLRWSLVLALAGVAAVSLRMSLLPVVLGLALLTPALRVWHSAATQDRGRPALALARGLGHAIVILGVVLGAHAAYRQAYGAHMACPPGYMCAEGQMRLGLVAPLIRPQHFERYGLPAGLAGELALDLRDHRNREAQIWRPDGLWARLESELGTERAREVAAKLSVRALQSDPAALLRMGWATLGDYFDDGVAGWRLQDDLGRRPPDPKMLEQLASRLRYDARGLAETPGPMGEAFLASRWWLTAVMLLLAPLSVACVLLGARHPRWRATALVVGFAALGLVSSHFLFSHIVSFRYLHPMPVFFLILVGLGLSALSQRRSGKASRF